MISAAAQAADRPVKLVVPPPVAKDAAAMPLIADPQDAAENKINAALARLDGNLKRGMADCASSAKESKARWSWQRSVDATMRGPGFLSFAITDLSDCGGAHPNVGVMSIVYDLTTGSPVDWTKLLPASLTGTVALNEGADGTKVVTLTSKRLTDLYVAGYAKGKHASDCGSAMTDQIADGPQAMMTWLDARTGGLAMVVVDVPHAIAACDDPVVVPTATLRQAGAAPSLLSALEAAHP
jgi:hypothetical protein